MHSFGGGFYLYLILVLSSRALGASFRPGVSSPTISTALTLGWTGWKFFAVIAFVASRYLWTNGFGLRPQLETKFKI